ncbi:ParB/RepB/Spo0J family partition protein [Streptomyces qinglanensis]|uniref:ParB/RepB/Spo0J family partition protein n=1 Tax=Streptomyces qinglanensis TaxID=943816 RepID=UPI00378B1C86
MAGRRTSLASLAGGKVEDVPGRGDATLVRLPLSKIVRTALNKRIDFGTQEQLTELGHSMERQQLQPIVVVSRVSYLRCFPEQTEHVGEATYVLANGERRLRAARQVNLHTIEAVIREEVAANRKTFLDAVATENLDRKNLDPIEEALTVETMVAEFGSARAVAEHRGKHETWVSQRRSLLRLSPAMQQLVREKTMPVEKARKLAKAVKDNNLDDDQQAQWWGDEQAAPLAKAPVNGQPPAQRKPSQENLTAVKSQPSSKRDNSTPPPGQPHTGTAEAVQALMEATGDDPGKLADALAQHLPEETLREMLRVLQAR